MFTICQLQSRRLLLIWRHILRTPSDPHLSELLAMLDRCPEVLSIGTSVAWGSNDTEKSSISFCGLT